MATDKSFVRGVRLEKNIDEIIAAIAKYEDRTVSKVIARFMLHGLIEYTFCLGLSGENDDLFNFIAQRLDNIDFSVPPSCIDRLQSVKDLYHDYENTIDKYFKKSNTNKSWINK